MQIPTDVRKKTYELTYLVPATLTGEEVQSIAAAVEKLITKHKGKIKFQEDWGKQTLAYTIKRAGKRHTEAVYKHLGVEFVTTDAYAFEKDLYLQQAILRHLCVVAAEPAVVPEKGAESTN